MHDCDFVSFLSVSKISYTFLVCMKHFTHHKASLLIIDQAEVQQFPLEWTDIYVSWFCCY